MNAPGKGTLSQTATYREIIGSLDWLDKNVTYEAHAFARDFLSEISLRLETLVEKVSEGEV